MATRTYVVTLLKIVQRLCTYITKYRQTIITFLPPSAIPAFNELEQACSGFLEVVSPEEPNP